MRRCVSKFVARWRLLGLLLALSLLSSGCRHEVAPLASSAESDRAESREGEGRASESSQSSPLESPAKGSSEASTDREPSSPTDQASPIENSKGSSEAANGNATTSSKDAGNAANPAHETPPARPTARRPAIPGQPLEISFDDLVIGMQADVVFRPWMLSDRAKEVDGQMVKVVGYLHGGVDEFDKLTGEIIILRNKECKFGPGGQADHLLRVFLRKGVRARFTDNAVEIQGTLKVNPWQGPDGNTWSLYDIDATGFKDLNRR